MQLNKIYQEDCLHFMRQLPAASLPLVIASAVGYLVVLCHGQAAGQVLPQRARVYPLLQ